MMQLGANVTILLCLLLQMFLISQGVYLQQEILAQSNICEYVQSLPVLSTFLVLHSRVSSWPYPQTLDQVGNACQTQTLAYYEFVNILNGYLHLATQQMLRVHTTLAHTLPLSTDIQVLQLTPYCVVRIQLYGSTYPLISRLKRSFGTILY